MRIASVAGLFGCLSVYWRSPSLCEQDNAGGTIDGGNPGMPIISRRLPFSALCLLLAGLSLAGCIAVPKQAFDPAAHRNIHSIALANIEFDGKITIKRYNPLFILIGSSGYLMQNMAQEERTARYMSRIGNFPTHCETAIRRQLLDNLTRQGYEVREIGMDFWPAMKAARAHQLPGVDAILRIRVVSLGYRANGASVPYQPSVRITAKMVDLVSRETLYEDTVAIGYKPSDMRMSILKLPSNTYHYPKLNHLLMDAGHSTTGIMQAMNTVVGRITADLKQPMETSPFLAESKETNSFTR